MASSTAPLTSLLSETPVAESKKSPWVVYLLRCADDTLYTGCTSDLLRRVAAHGRGRVKYTRGRLPVTVHHAEPAATRSEALRREAAIKRMPRKKKLDLPIIPS